MPEEDQKKQRQETNKEDIKYGKSRERAREILERPHTLMSRDKIQTVLATDYLPGLMQLIASLPEAPNVDPQELVERINAANLSPEALSEFRTRIELARMFCGETGRDLRRELNAFAQSQKEAQPGMLGLELLEQQEKIQKFLKNLSVGSAAASDILQPALSEELRQMIGKPESLYERIVIESNWVNRRTGNQSVLPETWRKQHPVYLGLTDTFEYNPMYLVWRRMYNSKIEEVNNKVVKKWIDLVGPTFLDPKQIVSGMMLDTLGFIPEEVYTKKMFRQKVKFEHLVNVHAELRKLYEGQNYTDTTAMGDHNKRRLLHSRAQLLRHLFTSGIAESVKKPGEDQVTLDANGLFINLSAGRKHKRADRIALHSHLPYSQVSDELLAYLLEHQWITEADSEEIRLQRAKVNDDVVTENAIEFRKADQYYKALLDEFSKDPRDTDDLDRYEEEEFKRQLMKDDDCPSEAYAGIAAALEHERRMHSALWETLLKNPELHVPEGAFRYFYQKCSRSPSKGSSKTGHEGPARELLRVASNLQQGIAKSDEKEDKEPLGLVEDLQSRGKILHDKRHYDVAKIIGLLLDEGLPPSYPFDSYTVFRGRLDNKGKDEVHFLESPTREEHYELVLIPRKHLNARQRREFFDVLELKRPEYKEWMEKYSEFYDMRQRMHAAVNKIKAVYYGEGKDINVLKEMIKASAEEMIQYFQRETEQPVEPIQKLLETIEKENYPFMLERHINEYEILCIDMFFAHGRQKIYRPELFRK